MTFDFARLAGRNQPLVLESSPIDHESFETKRRQKIIN
jgi:hypothetical protein